MLLFGNRKVRADIIFDLYNFNIWYKSSSFFSEKCVSENKIDPPSGWEGPFTNTQWRIIMMGRNFHMLRCRKSFWLVHDLSGTLGKPKQPVWSLWNMHGTFAWTIKEKNAFENQNGVTMDQAFKMHMGDHWGYSFRHFPVILTAWILWIVSNSRISAAIFHTRSSSSYQLQPHSLKLFPCNSATILDPNQPLLSKHLTSCQLQP